MERAIRFSSSPWAAIEALSSVKAEASAGVLRTLSGESSSWDSGMSRISLLGSCISVSVNAEPGGDTLFGIRPRPPSAQALAPGAVWQPNGAATLGPCMDSWINRHCSCGRPEHRRRTMWPGRARGQFHTRHELSGMLQALPRTSSGVPAGGHGELVFPAVGFAGRSVCCSASKMKAAGFVTINMPCR